MKHVIFTLSMCAMVASLTIPASAKAQRRLTIQRIIELTKAPEAPAPTGYIIEISEIGRFRCPSPNPGESKTGTFSNTRAYRVPVEFDPPRPPSDGIVSVTPTMPATFETIEAGWTMRVSTRSHGKLLAIAGVADYTTIELHPAGYGAVAGPIYSEDGIMVTPNTINQPKVQTTSTHFHIFALPSERYLVTFYRGDTPERHTVTVKPQ